MLDIHEIFLKNAIREIQSGEREKAKSLLLGILRDLPACAEAWFWLSAVVDEPREIAFCLRKTLSVQPDHIQAAQKLEIFSKDYELSPLPVMVLIANSSAIGLNCPFCQKQFVVGDRVVECPRCKRSHHYDCWLENEHGCAGNLCDGFSVSEAVTIPLPVQSPKSNEKVILIRKEDIGPANIVTRKRKETQFLRQMLIMALAAQEGAVPKEQIAGLPPVEQLLEQYLSEQESQDTGATVFTYGPSVGIQSIQPLESMGLQSAESKAETLSKFCLFCGKAYPRLESRYCVECGKPRKGV